MSTEDLNADNDLVDSHEHEIPSETPQNDESVTSTREIEASADDATDDSSAVLDPDATTNMWSPTTSPQKLQETKAPTVRSELLSLPNPDEIADDTNEEEPSEPISYDEAVQQDDDSEDNAFFNPQPAAEEPQPVKASKGTGRKVLKVFGIVCGVLFVIYLAGGLFFMSHFMPNTKVNNDDVSFMSVGDLSKKVSDTGASYTTNVTGDGMNLTIRASDISLSYDGEAYGADAASQIEPWTWPVSIFKTHDFHVDTGIAFDQGKLDVLVTTAVDTINANSQPPTNATMTYDEKQAKFVTVPDALGTMLDRDKSIATIAEGIRTLQTSIILGDKELAQPAVREDDERLAAVVDRANAIVKCVIPLRIAGRDAIAVDSSLIKNWITTNDHCELIVNTEGIKAWTQGDLSKTFDSVGTRRVYTRADGKQVTVEGGDYGWNLNGEELANLLADAIVNGRSDPIEVPMNSSAAEWNPGGADWGKRYVDVDIAEQHVRVYDETGALVLESDCVTGVPDHATDEGVYAIFEHTPNTTLVGMDYNGDGQPDYQTPVSYWMPFNGGMGLHDAYWRGAFGGDIYLYDGSHGCVNLPSDVAAQIFDWSHVGDVVVVHS